MDTLPVFDALQRDLRYTLRGLRHSPVFTTTALLTIAIGIGANTAVFSVVDAVLLRPLRYPKPEQLIAIWQSAPGASGLSSVSGDLRLSASMYFTYAEQNRTFQSMGVWAPAPATVTGIAEPEQVQKVYVSRGVLESFQVQPITGRWLGQADQDPGSAETVMLGYEYWQRRFGADQSAVGKRIVVDGRSREIVGVMPKSFRILEVSPELIVPARFDRSKVILPGFGYRGVGRLKPGVTLAQANADINRMVPIWMNSWPAFAGVNPRVYESWRIGGALRPLKNDVVGSIGSLLWVVMGTVGVVMLIVCANVGNLLLVRAEGRRQALAIRVALGAGWGRILRELLVESLLLSLMGGALGAGLAWAALKGLVAIGPATLPRLHEVALDLRALGFTFAVSLACGALFGFMPGLRLGSRRSTVPLNAGGRTWSATRERLRAQNLLVVCQVAMATVLLIASGLMVRTFDVLRTVQPGFSPHQPMQLFRTAFSEFSVPDEQQVARMQDDIVNRIAALSGITSVAFASALPLDGSPSDWDAIEEEGKLYENIRPLRLFKAVSPGFFGTMGTRLRAGRDYSAADLEQRRRVVILSANLARELWGTPRAAVGKRIQTLPTAPWREVIGVVEDVRDKGLQEPAPATVYWPSRGESWYRAGRTTTERLITFVVRSRLAGTEGLMQQVRQAVWGVNPILPMSGIQTMEEMYDRSLSRTSFALVMIAIAASMALLLGVVGIYGVLSYAVTQRRREIGIRLALGAQQGALRRMFVRHGMMLAGIGLILGVVASLGLTRLMSSLLFGIGFLDPIAYAAALLILALAAALASFLPAWQASTVDPAGVLTVE